MAGRITLDPSFVAMVELLQAGTRLGGESLRFAERQWATTLNALSDLQERLTSESLRSEAQSQTLAAKLKEHGRRTVDLTVDAATMYVLSGMKFMEGLLRTGDLSAATGENENSGGS